MRISDCSSDVCSSDLKHKGNLPDHRLVPCVGPDDIDPNSDTIKGSTRWAIATDADTPEEAVLHHLDQNLHAISPRGNRIRSEERRVGKEWGSTCRSRVSSHH